MRYRDPVTGNNRRFGEALEERLESKRSRKDYDRVLLGSATSGSAFRSQTGQSYAQRRVGHLSRSG